MLRKTKLAGIIASLLATPCFSGIYVGVAGGPEGAHFSQRAHVTRPFTFDVRDKQHFSGLGGFGSIFGGYFWDYNRFYLAGEINANVSSVEYNLVNDEFIHGTFSKSYFNIRYSEGVSFLPGYYFGSETVIYGRIGYTNGHLKIVESDPTIRNTTSNRSGIRYGLGVRHDIIPHLTFMMDYSQVNYSPIRSHVFEPFGTVTKNTKITPNTAQVAFGLIYKFDAPPAVYVK